MLSEGHEPERVGKFPQPGELWSLWDVLKLFRVDAIVALGEAMEDAWQIYHTDPYRPSNAEEEERVRQFFVRATKACDAFEFPRAIRYSYERLEKDLPEEPALFQFAYDQLNDLLGFPSVFFATADAAELHEASALFGKEVDAAFPSASPDIKDGGSCLALGLPNAAVFHFLRAMEVPLKALAREFGVSAFTDWNSALNETEAAVRDRDNHIKRPDWANEKDFFTDMIPFLFTVKNAWRNYTMHLKIRHTEAEAREIMAAAKSFMTRAAKRLKE